MGDLPHIEAFHRIGPPDFAPPRGAPIERLVGALMASDASAHVLTQALEAMVEARDELISGPGSLLARSEHAGFVLEQGISRARYALNQTDVEPA